MAPINALGDGVGSITALGSDVTEVTADGDVVWTTSAILDAVDHHWPTDEGSGTTLTDNVGSVTGTISGSTWTSLADAVGGYYLAYDNTDDLVNLGQDALNSAYSGDFTFTAFCRVDSLGSYEGLIGHYDGSTGIRIEKDDHDDLSMTFDGVAYTPSTLSFTSGSWHFVAVRYDSSAGAVDFRLDDTEDNGNSLSNPTTTTGADWNLGFSRSGRYWDGGIDEATFSFSYLSDSDLDTLRGRRSDI